MVGDLEMGYKWFKKVTPLETPADLIDNFLPPCAPIISKLPQVVLLGTTDVERSAGQYALSKTLL